MYDRYIEMLFCFGERRMVMANNNGTSRTDEMRAIYRQVYMAEQRGNGMSPEQAVSEYSNYAKEHNVYDMSFIQLKTESVNRLLDSGADYNEVKDGYYANTKASSRMASDMLGEFYSSVQDEAYERARSGEFTTVTERYLSDSQKDEIMLAEQQASEDRYGFDY